jgi:cell division septal protein FtsQ
MSRTTMQICRPNVAPPVENGTFFTLDINAARRGVQSVSWVRNAGPSETPNRLKVNLEEHQ